MSRWERCLPSPCSGSHVDGRPVRRWANADMFDEPARRPHIVIHRVEELRQRCSGRRLDGQYFFSIGLAMVMLLAGNSTFAQTAIDPTGRSAEPPGPLKE